MAVKFEENTQRKTDRFTFPVEVQIEQSRYQVSDWSFDGFSCHATNNEQLNALKNFSGKVQFILPLDGNEVKVPMTASAKWQEKQITGFQLDSLSDASRHTLSNYCKLIVARDDSGKEKLLAQPKQKQAAHPVKPVIPMTDSDKKDLNRKFLRNFAIYGILALLVAAIASAIVYFNNFVIVTHKAIVAADLTDIPVKLNAVVDCIHVKQGEQVQSGTPLYTLNRQGVIREMQELRQSIAKQHALINLTRVQVQEARRAQGLYVQSAHKDYETLAVRKRALADSARQMEKELALYENSEKLGSVSKLMVEQKRAALQTSLAQMKEVDSELNFSARNVNSAKSGLYYTSSGIKGNVSELHANIAVQQKALGELQARLNSLQTMQNDYVVKSPVSGYVSFVAPIESQYADAGTKIVSIVPRQQPPYIMAVFPSSMETQLRPGDAVEIYSPLDSKALKGKIEHIYLATVPPHIKPSLNELAVSIQLDDPDVIRTSGIQPFSNVLVRLQLNPFKGLLEKMGIGM